MKKWLFIALAGCGGPATFTEVKSQVFSPSCAFTSCHKGASPAGGLSLEPDVAYQNLVGVKAVGAPEKTRVVPGDPAASYILEKISPNPSVGAQMPPGAQLDPAQVALLRRWIEAGAPAD